jgi:putative membrane protein
MTVTTEQPIPFIEKPLHIFYSVSFLIFWIYTGVTTTDLDNWILENTLTLSLIIFLIAFYNIFRFSDISYSLIFIFLLLHVYGSQYQYTDNPLGEWFKVRFDLERNHYDRLVHLGFGLLLAYPMHDVFRNGFGTNWFLSYLLPIEITLSLSAVYELIEWVVADIFYEGNQQAMDFLGMQSDIWDAQKDIAFAFAGAIIAMLLTFLLTTKHKKTSHI